MDLFQNYRVVQEDGSLHLILYLNKDTTEFSEEFGLPKAVDVESLHKAVNHFVKEKLPDLEVKTVKVMVGSILVTSFALSPIKTEAATDFNMGYLYFGSTNTFINSVDRTQGVINVTAPSYFDINPDGSLNVNSKFDTYFISEMHKRNVKVVPFFSNHWDRALGRTALQNREDLSTQIAQVVEKYNLDGVNIDIENVTDVDRDNYTDFVRLLRQKIPANKEVSVAVAANPNGWTKGWHGSYDYQKLAQYADYLMIMAYDESYPGGPAGPVASISFAERSIQYALSKGVPRDKIVLGLPHYGRYWMEGATTGGGGITIPQVESMLNKYDSKVEYDQFSQSPKATVVIKPGDPSTVITGKTLSPGIYTIWYENEESIKAKTDLVDKYKIKGTGSWSLGQEDASIWYQFKNWIVPTVDLEEYPGKTISNVNLMDLPSSNSAIVGTLSEGEPLKIIEAPINLEDEKWYKVEDKSGTQGFISSASLNLTERISGKNRFEVAVNVSKRGWVETAETVIVSNYNAYADALAAAPLAYKENAPILLTHKDHLTNETKEEIKRLNPKKVIIVGGSGSVGDEVINDLMTVGVADVERIGGKDRFEVSSKIAERLGVTDTAVIADGLNYPDALAIAPYAAKNGYPILLANKNELPFQTQKALELKNITNTIVVGGEASVGQAVFSKLPSPKRIDGHDRFEVAANIINELNPNPESVYIATGYSFADALTGSVLAAKENAPLLLTQVGQLPASTKQVLENNNIHNQKVLGGTGSVSTQVLYELRQ